MIDSSEHKWKPEIDKKNSKICYIPRKEGDKSSQADIISKILIIGFNKLPTGFFKDGWGLTKPASTYLVPILKTAFKGKKVELIFKENQKFKIEKRKVIKIYFDYFEYKNLLSDLNLMKRESNAKIKNRLSGSLTKWFPREFNKFIYVEKDVDFLPGDLNKLLNSSKKILSLLSENDKQSLFNLYNDYFENTGSNIKANNFDKSINQIKLSKNSSQKIYIKPIIKRYEDQLKKTKQEENWWQDFFKNYLLEFNTNYHTLVEKQNIDIGIKLPDFLAIDSYNYIDVIEIKRPDTGLLLFDKSHKNYYWSAEIVKAISQAENYIHSLNTGADKLSTYLKDYKKIDVRAIRPKAIIIAGRSNEFDTDQAKLNGFKILNDSLKNITVVTFDDILDNLKFLIKKIELKKDKKVKIKK